MSRPSIDQARVLESLRRLFSALSHTVRGDLSVISNELAFFSTMIAPSELDRAKNRCRSITESFSMLQAINDLGAECEQVSLFALLHGAFPDSNIDCDKKIEVIVAKNATTSALTKIVQLFSPYSPKLKDVEVSALIADENDLIIRIGDVLTDDFRGQSHSLVDAAARVMGETSIPIIALCDVVLGMQEFSASLIFSPSGSEIQQILLQKTL